MRGDVARGVNCVRKRKGWRDVAELLRLKSLCWRRFVVKLEACEVGIYIQRPVGEFMTWCWAYIEWKKGKCGNQLDKADRNQPTVR